jgi:hypothetical protein
MSSRELLHTGFVLLGALLIVNALAALAGATTARPLVVSTREAPLSIVLESGALSFAVSLLGVALFGLLPGASFMWKGREWAARIAPEEPVHAELRPSALLAVGALLLGIAVSIRGVSGLVGGLASVVAAAASPDEVARSMTFANSVELTAASAASLVLGLLLARWGRGMIPNAL